MKNEVDGGRWRIFPRLHLPIPMDDGCASQKKKETIREMAVTANKCFSAQLDRKIKREAARVFLCPFGGVAREVPFCVLLWSIFVGFLSGRMEKNKLWDIDDLSDD